MPPAVPPESPGRPPARDMVWIPGGSHPMGSNDHYPEEAPAHTAAVEGFWMDRAPVTNAQFQAFVKATGHVTVAERPADPAAYPEAQPELLAPSSIVFVPPHGPSARGIPIAGGSTCLVPTGAIPRGLAVRSRGGSAIRWCT